MGAGTLTLGPTVAETKNKPKASYFIAATPGPRVEVPAPMTMVVCFSSKTVHTRQNSDLSIDTVCSRNRGGHFCIS